MSLSNSIQFSLAQEQDAKPLVDLINSAYRGDESRKGWTTEADFLDGTRIETPQMLKILRSFDSVMFKAVVDGLLQGCVYLVNKSPVCYLGMLTVNPETQGQGLGKMLIAQAEKFVVEKWNVKKIEMTVITLRKELIQFYGRQGYSPSGEMRPFPYQELNPGDAKRMDLEFVVLEKLL